MIVNLKASQSCLFYFFPLRYTVPMEHHHEVDTTEAGVTAQTTHHTDSHLQAHPTNHFAHILIFGGGLVAALILLVYGYIENRKSKNVIE